MADQDTSLPIRTEADGTDERLHVKIVDSTTPATQMTVDSDGNLHAEMHGNDPAAVDRVVRLSELGALNGDGDFDGSDNTKPSSVGLILHDRNAAPSEAEQNKRPTAVAGTDDTVCADVAIRDESGAAFSQTNPLPVAISQSEGTEVHDFNLASAIAKDATDNHDFSVATGVTFLLKQVEATASGKMKVEIQIGDGAMSEVFATKFVGFNSTANPNAKLTLATPIVVLGTADTTTVRVIRTNLDNQAQDLYSTIVGINES